MTVSNFKACRPQELNLHVVVPLRECFRTRQPDAAVAIVSGHVRRVVDGLIVRTECREHGSEWVAAAVSCTEIRMGGAQRLHGSLTMPNEVASNAPQGGSAVGSAA